MPERRPAPLGVTAAAGPTPSQAALPPIAGRRNTSTTPRAVKCPVTSRPNAVRATRARPATTVQVSGSTSGCGPWVRMPAGSSDDADPEPAEAAALVLHLDHFDAADHRRRRDVCAAVGLG